MGTKYRILEAETTEALRASQSFTLSYTEASWKVVALNKGHREGLRPLT
jgi:hypothetical protein